MSQYRPVENADLEDNPRYDYALDVFQTLKSYWLTLFQEKQAIPTRAQFNPAQVKNILRYVYMTEQLPDGTIQLRHKGTGLELSSRVAFISTEHIQAYDKMYPGQLETYFDTLFDGPCYEESRWLSYKDGESVVDFLCFSLPLYGTSAEHRIALGIVVPTANFSPEIVKYCSMENQTQFLSSKYHDLNIG
jgi:hypothetical protein